MILKRPGVPNKLLTDWAPIQLILVYVRVVVLCVVSKCHLVTKGHFNLAENSTRFNVHPDLQSSDDARYVWEAYKHFLCNTAYNSEGKVQDSSL